LLITDADSSLRVAPAVPSSSRVSETGVLLPPVSCVAPALSLAVDGVSPLIKKKVKRRLRAPKDSKVYKVVLVYLALKAQGVKLAEIAEIVGHPKATVSTYVKRAHKRGWINLESFDDPEDQLEVVLKSKAVRNINRVLDETDVESGQPTVRAGEAAMEVAKGTGLLKQHQVTKADADTNVGIALRVHVDMPANTSTQAIRIGSLGGTPAVDAEIIEAIE
jgi:predicted transcriptional regulator